jgi:hypothetical protein
MQCTTAGLLVLLAFGILLASFATKVQSLAKVHRLYVDVIVAEGATAIRVTQHATHTTSIVMAASHDLGGKGSSSGLPDSEGLARSSLLQIWHGSGKRRPLMSKSGETHLCNPSVYIRFY